MEEPENPKTSRGKLILIFIMETQKVSGGFSKAAMIFGIISVVFALLPMLSAWFMFLTGLNYVLASIGILCGVLAIVKSQNLVKSIVGVVLCVLALCTPWFLAEYYLESTLETAGNILNMVNDL
jgi:hypothetical protein